MSARRATIRRPRALAAAAAALAASTLAAPAALAHRFPPVRSVVLQVEPCEVALLVGYRPAAGEGAERTIARVVALPPAEAAEALRDLLGAEAMAPLTVTVDGRPLAPTSVRAKLSREGDGARPAVVVLATYALPAGRSLAVASRAPKTTRISWTDRDSRRVQLDDAPAQGRWSAEAAALSLELLPPPAGAACAASPPPRPPR